MAQGTGIKLNAQGLACRLMICGDKELISLSA